jgi:Family of unknown function (DUF6464)
MDLSSLSTDIILSQSQSVLGQLSPQENPQPDRYIEFEGQTYLILERRHHYQLKAGRYEMHKIALYVQPFEAPADMNWVDGEWIIGDPSCRFNVRSPLLRCAINPSGSCEQCPHRQPIAQS